MPVCITGDYAVDSFDSQKPHSYGKFFVSYPVAAVLAGIYLYICQLNDIDDDDDGIAPVDSRWTKAAQFQIMSS